MLFTKSSTAHGSHYIEQPGCLLLICVPALWLGIKLDLDIRSRNCDRTVERSPALEGLDELGALLLRDSLEVKV